MSNIITKSNIAPYVWKSEEEEFFFTILFKKALLEIRNRSMTTAMSFLDIHRITWVDCDEIPTACIVLYQYKIDPDIYLNVNFVRDCLGLGRTAKIKPELILASLLAHELFHYMLKHGSKISENRLRPGTRNLVQDIFINHLLRTIDLHQLPSLTFPTQVEGEWIFRRTKQDGTIEEIKQECFPVVLMNPSANIPKTNQHHKAYEEINRVRWSLEEIDEYLWNNLSEEQKKQLEQQNIVIYLGSHGNSPAGGEQGSSQQGGSSQGGGEQESDQDSGGDGDSPLDGGEQDRRKMSGSAQSELEDVIREAFTKAGPKKGSNSGLGASKFGSYFEEHLKVEKKKDNDVNQAVLKAMISDTKGAMLKKMGVYATDNMRETIFPTFKDKTDIVLLGAGHDLFLYHEEITVRRGRCVIYTDVSGSMAGIKEVIYGLLVGLETQYEVDLWLFSTTLDKLSKQDLKAGIVKTTGGTDFSVWIDHILENDYEKALIITDGYDSIDERRRELLKQKKTELFVVYTEYYCKKALEEFTKFSVVLDRRKLYNS